MSRKIKTRHSLIEAKALDLSSAKVEALITWLEARAEEHQLTTLLAHADDGVIWGHLSDKKLQLSTVSFPEISPEFDLQTLQACRLFGPNAEIYVWPDEEGGWHYRLIKDEDEEKGKPVETLDEQQILWGTDAANEKNGFTLLYDGAQENRHTPPISKDKLQFNPENNHRPVRLKVRHYLADDSESDLDDEFKVGLAYIQLSRLVALELDPAPKQSKITPKQEDADEQMA